MVTPVMRPRRVVPVLLAAVALTACAASPDTATEPAVTEAYITAPLIDGGPAGLYLTVTGGAEGDAVLALEGEGFERAELHVSQVAEGRRTMVRVDSLLLPAGGRLELRPGGAHMMLFGVDAAAVAAGSVAGHVVLRSGTRLPLRATFVEVAELEALFGGHTH